MTLFPTDILTAGLVLLRYKLKKRQIRMLRRFAQMMRWPNLTDTLDNMKQKDSELALDEVSSDAFAFFSGLVLPGVSLLFLYPFIKDVYRN
jgi:hypothetical protein